jgi:nucleolar protein 15
VAQIVAETMDNYLLLGHILQCKVIPKDEVHPSLWIGANRKWRKIPHDRIARVKHNKVRSGIRIFSSYEILMQRSCGPRMSNVQLNIGYLSVRNSRSVSLHKLASTTTSTPSPTFVTL